MIIINFLTTPLSHAAGSVGENDYLHSCVEQAEQKNDYNQLFQSVCGSRKCK